MRFLHKTSNMAKNDQNQGNHNFSMNGLILKQKTLMNYNEECEKWCQGFSRHAISTPTLQPYTL